MLTRDEFIYLAKHRLTYDEADKLLAHDAEQRAEIERLRKIEDAAYGLCRCGKDSSLDCEEKEDCDYKDLCNALEAKG